jgi:predicted RNA-binding protein with RPS1 domain
MKLRVLSKRTKTDFHKLRDTLSPKLDEQKQRLKNSTKS